MSVLPAAPLRAASSAIQEAGEVAAYLAAVEGTVWVTPRPPRERHEGVPAEPLEAGDEVDAETDSRASIYRVADAAILEATAGSAVLIGGETATSRLLDVPDEVRAVLRSGMESWGRWTAEFELGPMSADLPGQVTPLSPRNELVLDPYPTFFWTGEPIPLRLKVKGEDKLMYWAWRVTGSMIRYSPGAVRLQAGVTNSWWLVDSRRSKPMSATAFFTVAPPDLMRKVAQFEDALTAFEASQGSHAATILLRCAFYGELGAWTHLLAASRDLPVGPLQQRAWDLSRKKMSLDEGKATHLFALLVWKRLGFGGGDVGDP